MRENCLKQNFFENWAQVDENEVNYATCVTHKHTEHWEKYYEYRAQLLNPGTKRNAM